MGRPWVKFRIFLIFHQESQDFDKSLLFDGNQTFSRFLAPVRKLLFCTTFSIGSGGGECRKSAFLIKIPKLCRIKANHDFC